ncbi:hypothetical protein Tco_0928023 [Tanacetum coccineum]
MPRVTTRVVPRGVSTVSSLSGQPPLDHRRTIGQRRWSKMVNGGGPPFNGGAHITALTKIVKELLLMNKATQQAFVKAIEEICVTCGGPHPYYECLATDGNTFNASAATGTYNQGGPGYRPQGDPNYHASNQMGPPGFPSNVQNNQNYNRYNQNQGNYQAPNYQDPNFQDPNYQAQVGPSNELTNYMKSNEATLRAMQTQMTNMKTELRNEFKSSLDTRTNKIENQNNQLMNMLTNLTMQKQSPSGSRSLPSNTVANPRGDLKAITTRSGVALYMDLINYSNQLFSSSQEVNMKPEATKTRNVVQLPTIHSDYALPDYDAFYFDDDHIEEKSSDSTTTHSDFYLPKYDSFIFDLSIDPFPPADRNVSHHEEFADELSHILSPPEYDRFYFDLEADPGEFTSVLEKDLIDLSTKDFTSIELNNSPLLLYDYDSSLSKEFFEIDLQVSFPLGNEDIIFDPGIIIIKGVQSQRFKVPLKFFSTISFESDPLFLIDSPEIDTLTSFPSENEDKIFNPGILTSKVFPSRHSMGLSHQILKPSINKKIIARWRFFPSSSSIMEGISLL